MKRSTFKTRRFTSSALSRVSNASACDLRVFTGRMCCLIACVSLNMLNHWLLSCFQWSRIRRGVSPASEVFWGFCSVWWLTGTARTCFWLPKSTIGCERVCPILKAYSSQTYSETKPQDRADAVNRERPGPPEDRILVSVVARTTFLFSRSISRPTKHQRIPSSSSTRESLIIY